MLVDNYFGTRDVCISHFCCFWWPLPEGRNAFCSAPVSRLLRHFLDYTTLWTGFSCNRYTYSLEDAIIVLARHQNIILDAERYRHNTSCSRTSYLALFNSLLNPLLNPQNGKLPITSVRSAGFSLSQGTSTGRAKNARSQSVVNP